MDLSQFTAANVPVHEVVLATFYIVVGIYAIFSAILYYHWQEYATDTRVTAYTLITYFTTTLSLILAMGIMALLIS